MKNKYTDTFIAYYVLQNLFPNTNDAPSNFAPNCVNKCLENRHQISQVEVGR